MVEILDETNRFPHVDAVAEALSELMRDFTLDERSLTVVLLDDAAIRGHNRDHRGVDAPTDVLSYPTAEPDDLDVPAVEHLGDILISVDTAQRQASGHGHSLLDEVLVLAAHGLTHLRGFDHPTEERWEVFRKTQRRILELGNRS